VGAHLTFAEETMIKRILAAIGLGSATVASAADKELVGPYKDHSTNLIYHLLFCDRLKLFEDNHQGELNDPWAILFKTVPDYEAVAKIANDKGQESRVRMLAFGLLRSAKKVVPQKELLGTIIEVRMPGGLDTLAVFTDGGARYINHSGKIAVVEGVPSPFQKEIDDVIKASRPIVAAIGPWDKDRLPAPGKGNIRMTFLVSDGLYFGEGPMDVMQQEQMAAPLIQSATTLLLKLVERTTNSEQDGGGQPATRPESK
jgi:hypothetical protein